MSLNRFAIKNGDHAKFGALMKRWARQETPAPGTIDDLKVQLEANGIEAKFPTGDHELKKLSITWGLTERLDIRLPPVDHLDESEVHLSNPANNYELPDFYDDAYGTEAQIPDKTGFHNARIGDYTVANCI
jgi:hypothetical protein